MTINFKIVDKNWLIKFILIAILLYVNPNYEKYVLSKKKQIKYTNIYFSYCKCNSLKFIRLCLNYVIHKCV